MLFGVKFALDGKHVNASFGASMQDCGPQFDLQAKGNNFEVQLVIAVISLFSVCGNV